MSQWHCTPHRRDAFISTNVCGNALISERMRQCIYPSCTRKFSVFCLSRRAKYNHIKHKSWGAQSGMSRLSSTNYGGDATDNCHNSPLSPAFTFGITGPSNFARHGDDGLWSPFATRHGGACHSRRSGGVAAAHRGHNSISHWQDEVQFWGQRCPFYAATLVPDSRTLSSDEIESRWFPCWSQQTLL